MLYLSVNTDLFTRNIQRSPENIRSSAVEPMLQQHGMCLLCLAAIHLAGWCLGRSRVSEAIAAITSSILARYRHCGKAIEYNFRVAHFTGKVVLIAGKVQLPTGTANRQGGTLVSAGWYS